MGNRALVRRHRAPDPQPRAAPAAPCPAAAGAAPRRGRRAGTRGSGAPRGHPVLTRALPTPRRTCGIRGPAATPRRWPASSLPGPRASCCGVSTLRIRGTQGLLPPAAAERESQLGLRLFGRTSRDFQLLLGLGAGPRVSAGGRQRHCPTPSSLPGWVGCRVGKVWGRSGGRGKLGVEGAPPHAAPDWREKTTHTWVQTFYLQRRRLR